MSTLFDYYRNPIFGIVLLLFLALIAGLSSQLAAQVNSRRFAALIRAFASKISPQSDLAELSGAHLAELARAQLGAGNFLRAKELFEQLLARGCAHFYELGVCCIRLGLFSQAAEQLRAALRFSSRDERCLRALIYAEFKLGNIAAAADAARALAIISEDFSALEIFERPATTAQGKMGSQLDAAASTQAAAQALEFDPRAALKCPRCGSFERGSGPFCQQCFCAQNARIFKEIAC